MSEAEQWYKKQEEDMTRRRILNLDTVYTSTLPANPAALHSMEAHSNALGAGR